MDIKVLRENLDFPLVFSRELSCGDFDESHTLCKPNVGSACGSEFLVDQTLTDDEKDEILKIHNDYRSQIAEGNANGLPEAGNMRKLVWNNDLAQVAQKLADQCVFQHDHNDQR